MTATSGNTLAMLQSLQTLILANTGSTFAALSAADATRYGVSRAVYIGAPKDYKDLYLPQLHIIAESDAMSVVGAAARVQDRVTCHIRAVVDFSDWWVAEQSILPIRDTLIQLFATHLRAGAVAGGAVVALDLAAGGGGGEFTTVEVAGVWYRQWACMLEITQVYVPVGGFTT